MACAGSVAGAGRAPAALVVLAAPAGVPGYGSRVAVVPSAAGVAASLLVRLAGPVPAAEGYAAAAASEPSEPPLAARTSPVRAAR